MCAAQQGAMWRLTWRDTFTASWVGAVMYELGRPYQSDHSWLDIVVSISQLLLVPVLGLALTAWVLQQFVKKACSDIILMNDKNVQSVCVYIT